MGCRWGTERPKKTGRCQCTEMIWEDPWYSCRWCARHILNRIPCTSVTSYRQDWDSMAVAHDDTEALLNLEEIPSEEDPNNTVRMETEKQRVLWDNLRWPHFWTGFWCEGQHEMWPCVFENNRNSRTDANFRRWPCFCNTALLVLFFRMKTVMMSHCAWTETAAVKTMTRADVTFTIVWRRPLGMRTKKRRCVTDVVYFRGEPLEG